MKFFYPLFIFLALFLGACGGGTLSIQGIDTSNAPPEYVRQCVQMYSNCVSGGARFEEPMGQYIMCKQAYQACIASCAEKAESGE